MFASQDEIRIQLPQEMRGVVEKLLASGFRLGTVSAHELILWSGASPEADLPERARLLTVTLEGARCAGIVGRPPPRFLTPQEGCGYRQPHLG